MVLSTCASPTVNKNPEREQKARYSSEIQDLSQTIMDSDPEGLNEAFQKERARIMFSDGRRITMPNFPKLGNDWDLKINPSLQLIINESIEAKKAEFISKGLDPDKVNKYLCSFYVGLLLNMMTGSEHSFEGDAWSKIPELTKKKLLTLDWKDDSFLRSIIKAQKQKKIHNTPSVRTNSEAYKNLIGGFFTQIEKDDDPKVMGIGYINSHFQEEVISLQKSEGTDSVDLNTHIGVVIPKAKKEIHKSWNSQKNNLKKLYKQNPLVMNRLSISFGKDGKKMMLREALSKDSSENFTIYGTLINHNAGGMKGVRTEILEMFLSKTNKTLRSRIWGYNVPIWTPVSLASLAPKEKSNIESRKEVFAGIDLSYEQVGSGCSLTSKAGNTTDKYKLIQIYKHLFGITNSNLKTNTTIPIIKQKEIPVLHTRMMSSLESSNGYRVLFIPNGNYNTAKEFLVRQLIEKTNPSIKLQPAQLSIFRKRYPDFFKQISAFIAQVSDGSYFSEATKQQAGYLERNTEIHINSKTFTQIGIKVINKFNEFNNNEFTPLKSKLDSSLKTPIAEEPEPGENFLSEDVLQSITGGDPYVKYALKIIYYKERGMTEGIGRGTLKKGYYLYDEFRGRIKAGLSGKKYKVRGSVGLLQTKLATAMESAPKFLKMFENLPEPIKNKESKHVINAIKELEAILSGNRNNNQLAKNEAIKKTLRTILEGSSVMAFLMASTILKSNQPKIERTLKDLNTDPFDHPLAMGNALATSYNRGFGTYRKMADYNRLINISEKMGLLDPDNENYRSTNKDYQREVRGKTSLEKIKGWATGKRRYEAKDNLLFELTAMDISKVCFRLFSEKTPSSSNKKLLDIFKKADPPITEKLAFKAFKQVVASKNNNMLAKKRDGWVYPEYVHLMDVLQKHFNINQDFSLEEYQRSAEKQPHKAILLNRYIPIALAKLQPSRK